jgi:hypothetical protein
LKAQAVGVSIRQFLGNSSGLTGKDKIMKLNGHRRLRAFGALIVAGLALLLAQGAASANKKPKTYPETGKVVGTGTTGHTRGNGTVYSHTYKIDTDKVVFLLDCGKLPFLGGTGDECGGQKKIQIGDVIHFRIDKNYAYIAAPDPTGAAGSDEERLRIMSQEMKPEASPQKPADSQL